MICFSKYLRVVYYGCMVISLLHLQRIVVFAQIVSVRNTGVSFIDETNSTNFLYRSGCLRRHLVMPQFSLFGWQANLFVWRELCIWHQQNNQPLTVWLDTFQSFGYVPCNVSQIHGSVFRCCCRVRLAIVTFKAFIDSDSFVCHTMCAKKKITKHNKQATRWVHSTIAPSVLFIIIIPIIIFILLALCLQ